MFKVRRTTLINGSNPLKGAEGISYRIVNEAQRWRERTGQLIGAGSGPATVPYCEDVQNGVLLRIYFTRSYIICYLIKYLSVGALTNHVYPHI